MILLLFDLLVTSLLLSENYNLISFLLHIDVFDKTSTLKLFNDRPDSSTANSNNLYIVLCYYIHSVKDFS